MQYLADGQINKAATMVVMTVRLSMIDEKYTVAFDIPNMHPNNKPIDKYPTKQKRRPYANDAK